MKISDTIRIQTKSAMHQKVDRIPKLQKTRSTLAEIKGALYVVIHTETDHLLLFLLQICNRNVTALDEDRLNFYRPQR